MCEDRQENQVYLYLEDTGSFQQENDITKYFHRRSRREKATSSNKINKDTC